MVPPSILSPVTRHAPLAAAIVGGLRDVEATFAQQLRSDLPAVNELAQHVERYREIREACLIAALKADEGLNRDIGELARLLRVLSGMYDQAARAAASL